MTDPADDHDNHPPIDVPSAALQLVLAEMQLALRMMQGDTQPPGVSPATEDEFEERMDNLPL